VRRRILGEELRMRIAMIGSGYVGLVSGACFADFGHDVVCVDKDAAKIAKLEAGVMPIYEPGLKEIVDNNVRGGRLTFSTDLASAASTAEAIFIAVGTPSRRGDGYADLSFVYSAAREIAAVVKKGAVIVTKSTVPVGTGDEVERIVREIRRDTAIHVASNPEFLREGAAIEDFKHPDRIVIGAESEEPRTILREIYRPLYLNNLPIMFTRRRTAELIKYAANAFLATKITFINEIADLCEATGIDVQEVARGIGLDKRIGPKFLHAGPGYGGSCFPKDTLALIKTGHDAGTMQRIVETVVAVNEQRKRSMARKVIAACGGSVRGKTIAVLGLTFKPNTDDVRDSPSLAIIPALQDNGALVRAYDPEGADAAKERLDNVIFAKSAYSCIEGADALLLLTEWDAFRGLDLDKVKELLKSPVVVDLRNVYSPAEMHRRGIAYVGVGR
jgi:UDPglucose 6-dehydrogenase